MHWEHDYYEPSCAIWANASGDGRLMPFERQHGCAHFGTASGGGHGYGWLWQPPRARGRVSWLPPPCGVWEPW